MDQANIVIQNVKPLQLPQIEIEATDGKKYISNLKELSSVECFPKSQKEWEDVSITTYGFNLTWGTRFEVHLDQIIDHAISVEEIRLQA